MHNLEITCDTATMVLRYLHNCGPQVSAVWNERDIILSGAGAFTTTLGVSFVSTFSQLVSYIPISSAITCQRDRSWEPKSAEKLECPHNKLRRPTV